VRRSFIAAWTLRRNAINASCWWGRTARQSTLLKILAEVIVPQSGTRTLGHNVKAGYYSQNRVEMLDPKRTVFEEALDTPQRVTEQFVRTLLAAFCSR